MANLRTIYYSCGHTTTINEDDRRSVWDGVPNSPCTEDTAAHTGFAQETIYHEHFPCPSKKCRRLLKAHRVAEYRLLEKEHDDLLTHTDEVRSVAYSLYEEHFQACIQNQEFKEAYLVDYRHQPGLHPMLVPAIDEGVPMDDLDAIRQASSSAPASAQPSPVDGYRTFDVTYGMLENFGIGTTALAEKYTAFVNSTKRNDDIPVIEGAHPEDFGFEKRDDGLNDASYGGWDLRLLHAETDHAADGDNNCTLDNKSACDLDSGYQDGIDDEDYYIPETTSEYMRKIVERGRDLVIYLQTNAAPQDSETVYGFW